MQPERRETCKVCGRKLRPEKTKFCSLVCAERMQRWRHRKDSPYFKQFMSKVAKPVPIQALADKLAVDLDTAERRARDLAATGRLRIWEVDGHVTEIGTPLRPGEQPSFMTARRDPAARKETEQRLREKQRSRRRPGRRSAQRARKKALENPQVSTERECLECGSTFMADTPRRLCSPECRARYVERRSATA